MPNCCIWFRRRAISWCSTPACSEICPPPGRWPRGCARPPRLAAPLTDALVQARQEHPGLQILLLIDPASVQMRAGQSMLERLHQAGIAVVAVDVGRLRAPNAAFVAAWQLCCRWWSPIAASGAWPNPLGVGPSGVSMGCGVAPRAISAATGSC